MVVGMIVGKKRLIVFYFYFVKGGDLVRLYNIDFLFIFRGK